MAGRDVVNIGIALPSDIGFEAGDVVLFVRGDLEVRIALELMRLLDEFEGAYSQTEATVLLEKAAALQDYLLPLFQERQPKLEALPWGLRGMGKIGSVLLARIMGATDETLEGMADADPPTAAPPKAKPKPRRPST